MKSFDALNEYLEKAGPYIGPKGGKWADAKHTIPWKGSASDKARKIGQEVASRAPKAPSDDKEETGLGKEVPKRLLNVGAVKKMPKGSKVSLQIKPSLGSDPAVSTWEKGVSDWKQVAGPNKGSAISSQDLASHGDSVWTKKAWYQAPKGASEDLPSLDLENIMGKSMEADMKGLNELNEYLEKSQVSGIPTGNPKASDITSGGPEDGACGDLAGKGKTSGSSDSKPGPEQDANGQLTTAPKAKVDKLSEDDAEPEKQMKDHKKPIEKMAKSEELPERPMNPGVQREMVAHERAKMVSKLRKGEGGDIQIADETDEPIQKSGNRLDASPMLHNQYGNIDDAASELVKSESFYVGSEPADKRPASLMEKSLLCKSCDATHSAALTACPHCGDSRVQLVKSELAAERTAKPAPAKDVYIPE